MMKPIIVKQLYELCEEQIKLGNGNKVILISNDDEGNGYHYMWYSFTPVDVCEAEDYVNENIAGIDDTIILG